MFPEKPTLAMKVYCLEDALLLSDPAMLNNIYDHLALELLSFAGGDLYDRKKCFSENIFVISTAINQECIAAIREEQPTFN